MLTQDKTGVLARSDHKALARTLQFCAAKVRIIGREYLEGLPIVEAVNPLNGKTYGDLVAFATSVAYYGLELPPLWATLKQINGEGGRVIKGEKSVPVAFSRGHQTITEAGVVTLPKWYGFNLFHIQQTTLNLDKVVTPKTLATIDAQSAQAIFEAVNAGDLSAFYNAIQSLLTGDIVQSAPTPCKKTKQAIQRKARAIEKQAKPQDQTGENESSDTKAFARWFPVADIQADPKRFQNREGAYSAESVSRIVEAFDPNQLDPITVWKDQNTVYVLSGHSRLAAFEQLGKPEIPVKFFEGDEAQAIQFARVDANRGGTPESLRASVRAYMLMRDGGKGIQPADQKAIKRRFGRDRLKLEAFSHLNTEGKFMNALSNEAVAEQTPNLELRARWTGDLRAQYPEKLTNARESEIFDWLYSEDTAAYRKSKDDFHVIVESALRDMFKDIEEPLNLDGSRVTGLDARRDTRESRKRLREINREIVACERALNGAQLTQETKRDLQKTIAELLQEKTGIEDGIGDVLRSQAAMFD